MDPLSITAATLAIIQSVSITYTTIQHLRGLPKAFKEVGQNLALVEETLVLVQEQLEGATFTDATTEAIETVLKSCQGKAKLLNNVFQEINRGKLNDKNAKDWSVIANIYRTAVLRLGKAHRVESLMQDILNGLKGLTMNQVFRTATQSQMEKLEKAIENLATVEPSIKESEFDQGSTNLTMNIASGAKGNQFLSEGNSSQTNNLGPQYTSHGNMIFGTPNTEDWS